MIEQVYDNIFCIKVPLPQNPLRELNAWLIRGDERNLLVDSGFNRPECKEALDAALAELEVDLNKTDLFITHLHSDHAGLASYLARPGCAVWMGAIDGAAMLDATDEVNWEGFRSFIYNSGLALEGLDVSVTNHPGYRYAPEALPQMQFVADGDRIEMGRFSWMVVDTPGHTPGQVCLYEPEHKLLIAGDHILDSITPNITVWRVGLDSLGQYLDSLKKVEQLDVKLVLPGHRQVIPDHRKRIQELYQHHAARLQDVLDILGDERKNAAETARYMRWDLSYKNWDEFPWGQKFFAAGEAMAHLYHLQVQGMLSADWEGEVCYFQKVK